MSGDALELQSDAESSVGKPLAVNHSSECSQISDQRVNHQSFVQLPGSLGKDAHTQRADIFRSCSFYCARILKAGYFDRNGQPNPFFDASRPRRHLWNNLPI